MPEPQALDYKNLFRKLERTLAGIEQSKDILLTLSAILQRLVDDFRDELNLTGGRIYVRRGNYFVLQQEYPSENKLQGFKVPVSYPPIKELIAQGYVFHDVRDAGMDPKIEEALGVKTFAAIAVGEKRHHIIAFSLKRGSDSDQVIYALNTIARVINLNLRQMQLAGRVAEAQEIQLSLLPKSAPRFWDFEVWGGSVPAEEVGGDLFDYIPVSERCLGIAVADSSGHGLPAALQARDVIIGLRMGLEERLRITSTIEKLNKVIAHSALASKFISLFYAEIERNGNLVYCNAGHPPPLLLADGKITQLTRGGLVLGPNPGALYERGYIQIPPGGALLAYTDGITETENAAGEQFGMERLEKLLKREQGSAKGLVEAVFAEVRKYGGGEPQRDDQTVLAVVRRPART